jgi:hypothetical protein
MGRLPTKTPSSDRNARFFFRTREQFSRPGIALLNEPLLLRTSSRVQVSRRLSFRVTFEQKYWFPFFYRTFSGPLKNFVSATLRRNMFNENKSRNSGGGTFPDSGSALFYSTSFASFSSSLTRHTLSNGNTSISLKTNNWCVAHSTLLSDAAASAFQVAAALDCSLSSAFPSHPRLEPPRSDVLASGFPRGSSRAIAGGGAS